MNRIMLILFFVIAAHLTEGQENGLSLISDRTLYLSGEDIFVAGIISSEEEKNGVGSCSVMYFQLVNHHGRIISSAVLDIRQNSAFGLLKIPDSTPSDNYLLQADTRSMRTKPISESSIRMLKIINRDQFIYFKEGDSDMSENAGDTEILIQMDKDTFGQREMITPKFKLAADRLSKSSRFVISVAQKGASNAYQVPEISFRYSRTTAQADYQGQILSGRIQGSDHLKSKVHLSFFQNYLGAFSTYVTNEQDFIFCLPRSYGASNAFIYCEDTSRILSVEPQFRPLKWPDVGGLMLSHEEKVSLEKMDKARVVQRSYSAPVSGSGSEDLIMFYGEPIHRVILEDYVALPDLSEYIAEVLPSVYLRNHNGRKKLHFSNLGFSNPIFKPLILLDGINVPDINDILSVDVTEIRSIEVIDRDYYIGNEIYSGIFSLISKQGDFAGISLPDKGKFLRYKLYDRTVKTSAFSADEVNVENIPLFKNTTYWNGDLHQQDLNNVSFYTGDQTGEFEIVITGITSDGNMIEGRTTFSVK